MRTIRTALLATLAIALIGCASAPAEREIPADGSASAFVLNRTDVSITVYLVSTSTRHRLGFVDPMSSGRFRVPGPMVAAGGRFSFVAEGRGAGRNFGSDPFVLQPGSIANWRLPDSNVHVR